MVIYFSAGGPRGLLRRMRSQLAEDGCPDSQLVMGRTLLEQLGQGEAMHGVQIREGCWRGVDGVWLIGAGDVLMRVAGWGSSKGLREREHWWKANISNNSNQTVACISLAIHTDGDGGGGDEEEDGRLAVFWLTRASLQGSAEATHLLEQCLNNNIGELEFILALIFFIICVLYMAKVC